MQGVILGGVAREMKQVTTALSEPQSYLLEVIVALRQTEPLRGWRISSSGLARWHVDEV